MFSKYYIVKNFIYCKINKFAISTSLNYVRALSVFLCLGPYGYMSVRTRCLLVLPMTVSNSV